MDPVEDMAERLAAMTPEERREWRDVSKHGFDPKKTRRLDPSNEADRGLIELNAANNHDPFTLFVTRALEFEMSVKEFAERTVGTELQLGLGKTEPGEA